MKFKTVEINSIEKKYYKGKVYDLTVEKTHSYNIGGIAVHNSACTTREVAGVGVPQAYAVQTTCAAAGERVSIIADGGIKKPADVSKAIGLGATAVMIGGLFAGTDECPHLGRSAFRGMASADAQKDKRGNVSNGIAEGASFAVTPKGSVEKVVSALVGGLRSAMSYTGAKNIADFQQSVNFMRITTATTMENHAHFKP